VGVWVAGRGGDAARALADVGAAAFALAAVEGSEAAGSTGPGDERAAAPGADARGEATCAGALGLGGEADGPVPAELGDDVRAATGGWAVRVGDGARGTLVEGAGCPDDDVGAAGCPGDGEAASGAVWPGDDVGGAAARGASWPGDEVG
jgi:hypothetical protein